MTGKTSTVGLLRHQTFRVFWVATLALWSMAPPLQLSMLVCMVSSMTCVITFLCWHEPYA